METKEIKKLLQRYFDGITTENEEDILKSYFKSDNVVKEFEGYSQFFMGFSELSASTHKNIEAEIMDHIMEHEAEEKKGYSRLFLTITGIAASLIIIIGSILLKQQQKQFKDTFDNPDVAYAYATETLAYVSEKYSSGIEELSHFEKVQNAVGTMNQELRYINKHLKEK